MATQVPQLSTPPNPLTMTKEEFQVAAPEFLESLLPFADALNTVSGEVEQNALNAEAAAAGSAAAVWVTGTTYTAGVVRWSPKDFFLYRRKTNGAGSTDPSLDTTNWALQTKTAQGGSDTTSSSTDITLTASSGRLQVISMTVASKKTILPSATTLIKGASVFVIKNAGIYRFAVHKNGGGFLCYIQPGQLIAFSCADISSGPGVWITSGKTVENIFDGNTSEVLNAVDSRFIAVAMLSATKAICAFRNNSTTFLNAVVLNFGSASGSVAVINAEASENVSIAAQTPTQATVVYQTSTGVTKGYVLDISSNSITPGSVATIDSGSGGSLHGTALAALSATQLLCIYIAASSSTLKERVLDIASSAITPSLQVVAESSASGNLYIRAKAITAIKAIVATILANQVILRLQSITGSTPAPTGSVLAVAKPGSISTQTFGLAILSTTRAIVVQNIDHLYGDMIITLIDISSTTPIRLGSKTLRVGLATDQPQITAEPLDANNVYITWTGGSSLGVDSMVVKITGDDRIIPGDLSERLEANVTASNGYLDCAKLDATHVILVCRNTSSFLSAKTIEIAA